MSLKKYTENYLESRIQILKIDFLGNLLKVEGNLFTIKKGNKIQDVHPFFESTLAILDSLENKTLFSCVELSQKDSIFMVDVTFYREENHFIIIIADFTDHYKESNTLIQERNESIIKKNKLHFEKELLLEKEKLKNTFLAKLSNELRNPLGSMMSLVSLFQESKLNYDQTQILQLINKTGIHFENLLNDLLDISKISEGTLELKKVPFKINDITKYLENLYRIKAIKKEVKLKFDIDKKTPKILIGDPTRLKQILINLLENAFKYTKKGIIKISIKQEYERAKKATLLFVIEDNSKGLTDSELAHAFKEYKQINNLLNPLTSQSLGLKIVDDLVSLQKGKIIAKSTINQGTTFHITLPYQIPLSSTTKKKNTKKAERGLYKTIQLLLVDDSEINQLILTKYCVSKKNYKIDLANSVEMAKNLLEKKEYHVLLIDLDMPLLDASKLINNIKKKYKKIPIIAISGKALKKEKEKFLKLGINTYLTKPYSKDVFFEEINKLV